MKPGNIVIVPAGDVDYPAAKSGLANCNYLLFGVVIDFVYNNWEIGRADEEWDGVMRKQDNYVSNG